MLNVFMSFRDAFRHGKIAWSALYAYAPKDNTSMKMTGKYLNFQQNIYMISAIFI
jgi:hypothetical protein